MIMPTTVSIITTVELTETSYFRVYRNFSAYQERACKAYQATSLIRKRNRFPEVVISREPKDVDELRGVADGWHGFSWSCRPVIRR